jgi:hypothetical protein
MMNSESGTDHWVRQELYFVVIDGDCAALRSALFELVGELASSRSWQCGPPQVIDDQESFGSDALNDVEAATLGGRLEIYSAIPVGTLPRDLDLQAFHDASVFISRVAEFSREHAVTIDFYLDAALVGEIRQGRLDRLLSEGLLGEWSRHLGIEQ